MELVRLTVTMVFFLQRGEENFNKLHNHKIHSIMKLRNLFAFAFALVASVGFAQAMPDVPADTAFRTGKLANGLTYYVRHNNLPGHHVNF